MRSLGLLFAIAVSSFLHAAEPPTALPLLQPKGENFVDNAGASVRFWGVNVIALYPEHSKADALAKNLCSLGMNLVRQHHLLRPSLDWNPQMVSGCLALYQNNSRDLDPVALNRFDYLNAALKRHGIYITLAAHFSRIYHPGDVEIMATTDEDQKAWKAAMEELNHLDWQKSIDPYKMVATIDERAARLNEEFVKKILTHVNPFTGVSYAQDPQVLTFEVVNESSAEYAIICGNRFPAYWQAKLEAAWSAFATAAGVLPGDLYQPADNKTRTVRAKFLAKLDEDYFKRIQAVVRSTGSRAAIEFSNLWRGDNALAMHARHADTLENHAYINPLVVQKAEDGLFDLTKSQLKDKPFIVGELNQAEGEENIRQQSPYRTMLPLAASAYGSLHNWSGVVWFAWLHGGAGLGEDGWSAQESRGSELGRMMNDGMMIDHQRTTSTIFRLGLLKTSKEPMTLWVDEPFTAGDYGGLMRGKYVTQAGWQNIHGFRKSFGPVPTSQPTASWMTSEPRNPMISDTGEIAKDTVRRQLTISASQAEAFSGFLDGQAPALLNRLHLAGQDFATVILVSNDDQPIEVSEQLVISRTSLDANNSETDGPQIRLRLKAPPSGKQWYLRLTRPREAAILLTNFAGEGADARKLKDDGSGEVSLPQAGWHEGVLELR